MRYTAEITVEELTVHMLVLVNRKGALPHFS
jgi:hypothetical protein